MMQKVYIVCPACKIGGYMLCPKCSGAGGWFQDVEVDKPDGGAPDRSRTQRIKDRYELVINRQLVIISHEAKEGFYQDLEYLKAIPATDEVVTLIKNVQRMLWIRHCNEMRIRIKEAYSKVQPESIVIQRGKVVDFTKHLFMPDYQRGLVNVYLQPLGAKRRIPLLRFGELARRLADYSAAVYIDGNFSLQYNDIEHAIRDNRIDDYIKLRIVEERRERICFIDKKRFNEVVDGFSGL